MNIANTVTNVSNCRLAEKEKSKRYMPKTENIFTARVKGVLL
jgi:hypothetical protein